MSAQNTSPQESCWYKILTASGPGAVAVIEFHCHDPEMSQFILRRLIAGSATRPSDAAIGRIWYGRWNDEDLIVVRTSELTWEIQCHGGSVAVDRICRDLQDDGAVDASHAADAAKTAEHEDVQRLVHRVVQNRLMYARSRKTVGLILAQTSNSLCSDLKVLQDLQTRDTSAATAIRQRLCEWQDVADHLTEPWRVVLAGPPNVGKSSLMNAIAGMDRSIVCDQPGTTRDVVEVDTVIEGWPFRFIDTAGLRASTTDHIEELGIQQSHLAAAQCDVLCAIVDADTNIAELRDWLREAMLPKRTAVVWNKSDLLTERTFVQSGFAEISEQLSLPTIHVSALSGEGVSTLLHWIKSSVVPQEPTRDTALPLITLDLQTVLQRPDMS